jgi:hypothetical protein
MVLSMWLQTVQSSLENVNTPNETAKIDWRSQDPKLTILKKSNPQVQKNWVGIQAQTDPQNQSVDSHPWQPELLLAVIYVYIYIYIYIYSQNETLEFKCA